MRLSTAILAILYIMSVGLFVEEVYGHGSMETPLSRIYNCFLENPENPKTDACKAAVQEGGTQALYDWNGVNQGSANDMHREIIPDGKLCSGGKELFKGMDLARNDWPSTMIAPDQNGSFEFVFIATAPHSTDYFRFYVTEDGYNPLSPLNWSDLEDTPFCTIND
ncbi:MAG: lytic polysaccharide monooxygenase, partial [Thermodesulfobacteriota bacterium]